MEINGSVGDSLRFSAPISVDRCCERCFISHTSTKYHFNIDDDSTAGWWLIVLSISFHRSIQPNWNSLPNRRDLFFFFVFSYLADAHTHWCATAFNDGVYSSVPFVNLPVTPKLACYTNAPSQSMNISAVVRPQFWHTQARWRKYTLPLFHPIIGYNMAR